MSCKQCNKSGIEAKTIKCELCTGNVHNGIMYETAEKGVYICDDCHENLTIAYIECGELTNE